MKMYKIRNKSNGFFYTPDYPYKTKQGKIYSSITGVKLAIKAAMDQPSRDFRPGEWEVCFYSSEPARIYEIKMEAKLKLEIK